MSTTCYVLIRILIRPILKLTPNELFNRRKPNISHLRIFGRKYFILNNGKSNIGKFDSKIDEGIFLGYSLTSKTYRIYNERTLIVEESIHVAFDECLANGTNMFKSRKSADSLETGGDSTEDPSIVQANEQSTKTD